MEMKEFEIKTLKDLTKRLTWILTFIMGIGLTAITWYMNSLNIKLESLAFSNNEIRSELKEFRIKSDLYELKIEKIERKVEMISTSLSNLDKQMTSAGLTLMNHQKILDQHDKKLNSSRD